MAGQLDLEPDQPRSSGAASPSRIRSTRRSSAGSPRRACAGERRLPTTRELAAALGINRGTVQAAYRRLQETGSSTGRVGSGTVVRARGRDVAAAVPAARTCSRAARAGCREETPPLSAPPRSRTSRAWRPTSDSFPLEEFTRTLSYAWSRRRDLWQYAPPLGLEELRGEISRRLAENGIARSPDEILVVSGAQQGLDLLFRTFTDPDDVVAVGVADLLRRAHARAAGRGRGARRCPWTPRARIRGRCSSRRAKLVYLMPERQNPTGVTTTEERRAAVLEAALSAGALVVEDGYEEPESGQPPLAAREPERDGVARHALEGPRAGIPDRLDRRGPADRRAAGARQEGDGLSDARAAAGGRRGVPARRSGPQGAREPRRGGGAARGRGGAGAVASTCRRCPGGAARARTRSSGCTCREGVSGRRVAEAAAARGVGVAPGAGLRSEGRGPAERAPLRLARRAAGHRAGNRAARGSGAASAVEVRRGVSRRRWCEREPAIESQRRVALKKSEIRTRRSG